MSRPLVHLLKMASVPGGVFTMGQEPLFEAEAPNPPHRVTLSAFELGVHPVTNAQYRAFVDAGGAPAPATFAHSTLGQPDRPVVGVSWKDALRFCAWAGGTLPTEAQWERAARGDDGRRFPWGDEPPDEERACFAEDWNRGGPSPVGGHPRGAGPHGCEDLAGNVWEWCLDTFRADAHLERSGLDPCVSGPSRVRPLRGGCFRSIDCKLQAAYRNWAHEVSAHITIGFRLCIPSTAAGSPPGFREGRSRGR